MKRLVLMLTLALSLVSFSSFAKGTEDVAPAALQSFKSSFKSATDITWSVSENFFKADFSLNGQFVAAYYDVTGKLIAITRNISSTQLPISLQASLKKSYDCFWISDLFEIANDEGTTYYMTLETGDTKTILKANGSSDWTIYKKERKS